MAFIDPVNHESDRMARIIAGRILRVIDLF